MNCTFFGHKDTPDGIQSVLKETILSLAEKEKIDLFLVGNNGNFDFFVQRILEELGREGKEIRFRIVLSRPDERALSSNQEATVFPEELDEVLPKFAISKRNEWLIRHSSFLISYVRYRPSNSAHFTEKAVKAGLAVIRIAI